MKRLMTIGGIALGLCVGMNQLLAQNGGNGGSNQGGGNQGGGNRYQGGNQGGGFQGGGGFGGQGGGGFQGGNGGGGRGGRNNFDPAQMVPMIVTALKDTFEVMDDAEWKVISDRLTKVVEASMQGGATGGLNVLSLMGRQAGRGRGGNNGNNGNGGGGGGRTTGMGGLFGADPEGDALQQAIDLKASNAELKAAVAKVVEARKAKQAALEKARTDLRQVLTVRQEAIAYSLGLF